MEPRDLYVKVTGKDGKSHIEQRRVWNADRFLSSLQAQHAKEGGKAEMSSEAAYQEQRNKLAGRSTA